MSGQNTIFPDFGDGFAIPPSGGTIMRELRLTASAREAIAKIAQVTVARHAGDQANIYPPTALTATDKDDFLADISPEHRGDGEEHWDAIVEQNERQNVEWNQTQMLAIQGVLRQVLASALNSPSHLTKYLTVETVAKRWDVCVMTVRRYVASGKLPSTNFGRACRIRLSDVEAFEKAQMARYTQEVVDK